ncbi:MAG: fructose-bisphosphate aldolase class II [Thermoleophilaceae bacterium]|nr:fructose-bisphosphate aldolase class II [Thermoleophilaceae bacterium]
MPLVSMRQLLDEAAGGGYGVGAFNVNNMEQIQGIMEAARETSSPVIAQASRGARSYAGDRFLYHLMLAAAEEYPEIPVALHQDHGNSPETCISAIALGFTSVMMDGSLLEDGKTVADYEYNVQVTREVVEHAHARGVTVEGELGTLGGIEDGVGSGTVHLTDPDQAADFVERTGIDALALAIGTSHGAYKFDRKPDGRVLAMHLVEEIHRRLPDTHLVMHGSSSVPATLIDRINASGGRMRPAFGVPVEEIQLGIRHGVRKVNVDTDGRLAITAAVREALAAEPEEFDPRHFTRASREGMKEIVAERMRQFGQSGHAGDYEPRSLDEMRDRYTQAGGATTPSAASA